MEVLPSIPEPAVRERQEDDLPKYILGSNDEGAEKQRSRSSTDDTVSFVVRNTFIEGVPQSPSFANERQAQSCPGTSLMPCAAPLDLGKNGLGSALGSLLSAVPASPISESASVHSPGLAPARVQEKPWGPDLVASLVSAAAEAVQMHTPSLPGASRRSSPLLQGASASSRRPSLVDPVASVVASAATIDAPDMQQVCGTPSPFQSSSMRLMMDFPPTPSPWPGPAVLNPELASKLMAQGGAQKGEDPVAMLVASAAAAATVQTKEPPPRQDPVAMLVASAAAAATVQPKEPPPQGSPTVPLSNKAAGIQSKTAPLRSPGVGVGSQGATRLPASAVAGRLPRVESDRTMEESDNSATSSAGCAQPAPDAKAMAQSFAALVTADCNPTADAGTKWWQPLEAQPQAMSDSSFSTAPVASLEQLHQKQDASADEAVATFVTHWGLDESCERLIRTLPPQVQNEVFSSFCASAETRNVNAKFMSWLSSRMRHFEEAGACLTTTLEERNVFYARWRLDNKCRQLVENQPPSVQRELISNFCPPAGTKNVAGKMTAFLNMILSKTRVRRTLEETSPSVPSNSSREQPRELEPQMQDTSEKVNQFALRWGLDHGAIAALMSLPPETQEVVMDGFSPSAHTESLSRKFVAYLKTCSKFAGGKGSSKGSGGKGRGAASKQQPQQVGVQIAEQQPVPAGMMVPQKVGLV